MNGVRGRLISASFAEHVLPTLAEFSPPPEGALAQLERWAVRCEGTLGPASSVRAIVDSAVLPLLRELGLDVTGRVDAAAQCRLLTAADGRPGPLVVVTSWSEPLAQLWRTAVVQSISADVGWCLCCNGPALRVVDARHTWSRDFLEFDLLTAAQEPGTAALLWTVVRGAVRDTQPALERLAYLSAAHASDVCKALGAGVLDALTTLVAAMPASRAGRVAPAAVFDHALTVLYRLLFLLFAEARGLLPLWHPVYRDRYSLETVVTTLLAGRTCRGLWQALAAISRLAHAGCVAGELRITAFNGRLFSPEATALGDVPVPDATMGRVVAAVSITPGGRGEVRRRIGYRELDVEQLGAVYEQLLDYEPAATAAGARLARTRQLRKSSGAFYTPRAVTACLVRQTLQPLVVGRTAEQILALRLVDPAMGSGAFLVGACRYLALALEDALVREGRWHQADVTATDRTQLRREIAGRCLYGVDLNPTAVQLGRLSLWLATLAADKPLTFLDHRLVAGDSLVGAAPGDVLRQPGGASRRRAEPLPLFEGTQVSAALRRAVDVRERLAHQVDDSAAVVRAKERALAALSAAGTAVGRLRQLLDLWCAGWFWTEGTAPPPGTARELGEQVMRGRSVLPSHVASPLLEEAALVAANRRFLHWHLTFPEVFAAADGTLLPTGGFDAVLGNPPWDMVRGDSGGEDARSGMRQHARRITGFVRGSGIYRVGSRSHLNQYQLFVERALQLVRPGGRVGFVLPAGFVSDTGSAPLRRHLFAHAAVDRITGLDNRGAIFPIHRSVRFVLLTCTAGTPTETMRCRFGITRIEQLAEADPAAAPPTVEFNRALLARVSGADDLGLPEVTTERALRIVERVSASVPWLSAAGGWQVQFGRELNASDDRDLFTPYSGSPAVRAVVEGKQIAPFRVDVGRSRLQLTAAAALRVRIPRRPRLAYRDIASATNRLTLIAAIVPAQAVTTHTLFCLKTPLPLGEQQVLCALLNSFVANYLIRLRVSTHVTVSLVARLPVPRVEPSSTLHKRIATLSATLTDRGDAEDTDAYVEIQARAAQLYHLTTDDLEHVLGTFPLIDKNVRAAVLATFRRLH